MSTIDNHQSYTSLIHIVTKVPTLSLSLREITGVENIYMVIGGTHLLRAKGEQIDKTLAKLNEFEVERLGASHCTGMLAAIAFYLNFGNRFFFNNAGTILEV